MIKMEDFECGICGATFQNKYQLDEHIKETHGDENTGANYKCSECGETFGSQDALIAHIKADHPSG
jgi:DNA-directed RNA polymerase subunit RPC12/RpoP